MKFFVPYADSPEQADRVWNATRDFLTTQGRPTQPERYGRIVFTHNGKHYDLKVGDIHPDLREEVFVIFKGIAPGPHYICTPSRGVVQGEPYLVGWEGARLIEFLPADAGEDVDADD
ncbi:hypothetical protein ASD89_17595 [Caulobacter sp. Root656]|nr:hypothetical protein ASD89_17595 [Caulobacter sp. Root656]